jgi:hypothetical protein
MNVQNEFDPEAVRARKQILACTDFLMQELPKVIAQFGGDLNQMQYDLGMINYPY